MKTIAEIQQEVKQLSKKSLALKSKASDSPEDAKAYREVFELLEKKLEELRQAKLPVV